MVLTTQKDSWTFKTNLNQGLWKLYPKEYLLMLNDCLSWRVLKIIPADSFKIIQALYQFKKDIKGMRPQLSPKSLFLLNQMYKLGKLCDLWMAHYSWHNVSFPLFLLSRDPESDPHFFHTGILFDLFNSTSLGPTSKYTCSSLVINATQLQHIQKQLISHR